MNEMLIENAKYFVDDDGDNIGIQCDIDGVVAVSVPLDQNNRHYAEIMRQVTEGTLTIADAD
mgnify:CR=1 FL=1|tara:strand:- start:30 stop:215 length:186 start_codon:yes stop_codon:yes gene_type:complete